MRVGRSGRKESVKMRRKEKKWEDKSTMGLTALMCVRE